MSVVSYIYVSCKLRDIKIGTAYERDETTGKLRHSIRPLTSHRSQSRYVTAYYVSVVKCNWTKIYIKKLVKCTYIWSVTLYGAETWTVRKGDWE
jgi:hypothetical protein